jgi:2-phosphosulfolactate phosphatase
MVKRIDIAMTPAEAELFPNADAYVVIDALRATTTIATLFARGLRQLRVVTDVASATASRTNSETLLFGEIGGLKPEGFDYGNSPAEAATLDLEGRDAVLMTSNGTKALCTVAELGPTASGALVNLSSVVRWGSSAAQAVVVCSGNHGARQFSLEDFAVAAEIVKALVVGSPGVQLGDAAKLSESLIESGLAIRNSAHAGITAALGFAADVDFAATENRAPSLPIVVEHGLGWAVLENRSSD